MEEKKVEICEKHNLPLCLYCIVDHQKICMSCIRGHTKQGHEVMNMDEYCSEIVFPKLLVLTKLIKENESRLDSTNATIFSEAQGLLKETLSIKKILQELLQETIALESILSKIPEKPSTSLAKEINKHMEKLSENAKDLKKGAECKKGIERAEEKINFLLNSGDAYETLKKQFFSYKKSIENTTVKS